MEEENKLSPAEALGRALQWACSPRGGNNFYGRVLNGCSRQVQKDLGTCGVTLDLHGRYIFLWDPSWFVKQEKSFQLLIMIHEAAHLVLRHLERNLYIFRNQSIETQHRLADIRNIAQDMAANDVAVRPLIGDKNLRFQEHTHQIVWPESRDYPVDKTFDEYFLMLLRDLEKCGWFVDPKKCTCNTAIPGEGKTNSGGYPQWFFDLLGKQHHPIPWERVFEKASEGQIERAERRARREAQHVVRRAVKQTQKGRGTVPGNLASEIEALLTDPTVPWSVVLFGLVKSEISSKLQNSTAFPSVALLNHDDFEPFPGYQNDFTFTIVAAFDTSGSMSNNEIRQAYSELIGVLETEDGVIVRLLHFDAAIQHEELLSNDSVPELRRGKLSRYGHGGTDFQPPLRYILGCSKDNDWVKSAQRVEQPLGNVDLILLFTDGGAPIPFPELEPQVPFFWVITTHGTEKPEMKRVLHIT